MSSFKRKYKLETELTKDDSVVCKSCGKETNHKIIASYKNRWEEIERGEYSVDGTIRYQILQCNGCEEVTFRVVETFSEDFSYDNDGIYLNKKFTHYPARVLGLKSDFEDSLPDKIQQVYDETVIAIENELLVLAGIGIRAIVDLVCKDLHPKGKILSHQINWLRENAHISEKGKDALHEVRELGNKSAHEGEKNTSKIIIVAMQVVEHLLNDVYIISNSTDSLKRKKG